VAIIKDVVKNEVRVMFIDAVRLVEGDSIDQCLREIVAVLDKSEESCTALHFGQVNFMSSAALGMLIRVSKRCKEYQVDLKLCNISPEIKQVFKITGMDKVFSIYDDLDQALEAFKKSGKSFFRKKKPESYEVGKGG
jgi:anti-anti-sigma factor